MAENENQEKTIELPSTTTVRDLADMINASPIDIIKVLMANGVMANINQQIDFDTAAIVAAELGFEATLEVIDQLEQEDTGQVALWRQLISDEDSAALSPRPPVVTILGHVDHGKTSLLDAIRSASVAAGEAGGITQHISAYQIKHNKKTITFLDTPGHAAFTAMRSRGAQGADVVILVVAADDGVMPQTKEALNHAKAAKVPIVVALNKIDKTNANPDRVKQQLAEVGLIPDEWDGDTLVVPVSATEQTGLEDLMEAILLVADTAEIMANPEGQLIGTVIEAERDRARGVLATILVQNGTLRVGDTVVAGLAHGRIRAMFNHLGENIEEALPSTPISIMGLNDVPKAGDLVRIVESDKEARTIVSDREEKLKNAKLSLQNTVTLENMFEKFKEGQMRELRLIIKADVQGSLEPIVSSLNDMSASDDEGKIRVNILHAGTGNISESDIDLAAASQAIVMGFNVQADEAARVTADREGVSIRFYSIIYRLTEDVENALKGMLAPEEVVKVIGKASVRATFKIPKVGVIAGCRVVDGEFRRNAEIRVLRNDNLIYEGDITSLKHEKDDVREIRSGFECGIGVRGFDDFREGDVLECITREMVKII
ncbi:MAG TPA: translation initiation factor IF-2 [Anaerolineales bacterium]|nr:translation initiation factor IF-2 [Anaerolineales bacterium]